MGVDLRSQTVQQLQDLVRREVQTGVGADRRAELAHDRGRADAAAHDVADDEGRAAAAEVITSYQSPPTAASVPPGWCVAAIRRSSGSSNSCGSRLRCRVTAVSRCSRSLVRSRSAASAWSVTSAAKISTPGPSAVSSGVQVTVYERWPPDVLRDFTVRGFALRSTWSRSGRRLSSSSSGRASRAGSPQGRSPKGGDVRVVDVGDAVLGAVHPARRGPGCGRGRRGPAARRHRPRRWRPPGARRAGARRGPRAPRRRLAEATRGRRARRAALRSGAGRSSA